MSNCSLTVLGCGSASPLPDRHHSAHILKICGLDMLLDCGEGTQFQMVKHHIKYQRIDKIFITHLHGDHFYGLFGLLNTMALNRRSQDLHIIGPAQLKEVTQGVMNLSESPLPFNLIFHEVSNQDKQVVWENELLEVSSIPLQHRVPATGYIFKEKVFEKKLNVVACEEFGIPVWQYKNIKKGKNGITSDGRDIENHLLTLDPIPPKSFAYITDTKYLPEIAKDLQGVDLLYHEATFLHNLLDRAEMTMHSTAKQAAELAVKAQAKQLMIGHFSARYRNPEVLLNEAEQVFQPVYIAAEGVEYPF